MENKSELRMEHALMLMGIPTVTNISLLRSELTVGHPKVVDDAIHARLKELGVE